MLGYRTRARRQQANGSAAIRILLMRRNQPTMLRVAPFLLALPLLVYCFAPVVTASAQARPKTGAPAKLALGSFPTIHYGEDQLPPPVREMREAMQAAAQSGDIEELRQVYELNDIRPDLGSSGDPVAHWKRTSGDGRGLEILAVLSLILEAGYVVLPLGRDLENNRLYIWPYFAEIPLDKLTAAQEVELLRLVPSAMAKAMKASGKYTYWRVTIGADGSWHSFRKD